MMVQIEPSVLRGTAAVPPSKSLAHRLLLCAALAPGESRIRGVTASQDLLATLDCISALGAEITQNRSDVGIRGGLRSRTGEIVLPCRESGSTLRFLFPVAAALGLSAAFTGSERLLTRGVGVFESLFAEKGLHTEHLPGRILLSGRLEAGDFTVRGDVSSQYVSGLLFALPLLAGDSRLFVLPPVESRPYIRLTLEAIRSCGIQIEELPDFCFRIPGGQRYHPVDRTVEGDWSNAAVLLALQSLGSDLRVTGLNPDSAQGDRVCPDLLNALRIPNAVIDVSDCPDLAPVLFAAAAMQNGAVFTGTRRLRLKECDRGHAMAEELSKFGISTLETENRFTVFPGRPQRPELPLDAHNDHRMVMALTLLCSRTGGTLCGTEVVCKSWPDFFPTMQALGLCFTAAAPQTSL